MNVQQAMRLILRQPVLVAATVRLRHVLLHNENLLQLSLQPSMELRSTAVSFPIRTCALF